MDSHTAFSVSTMPHLTLPTTSSDALEPPDGLLPNDQSEYFHYADDERADQRTDDVMADLLEQKPDPDPSPTTGTEAHMLGANVHSMSPQAKQVGFNLPSRWSFSRRPLCRLQDMLYKLK